MDAPTYVLAIAGALLGAWRAFEFLGTSVNHEALTHILIKLVEAGNLDRAKKLLEATGKSVYGSTLQRVFEDAEQFAGMNDNPKVAQRVLDATFERVRRRRGAG